MKHADFTIGMAFETSTGQRWSCTDVDKRTITAIELTPDLDSAWFNGPPYSVPEVVFDEAVEIWMYKRECAGCTPKVFTRYAKECVAQRIEYR